MITPDITTAIIDAEARALATTGPHGVNVVPVSVVDITNATIYLYDFFMGKSAENLCAHPSVALSAWSGLSGVQVKADAQYICEGELFEQATTVMLERFPERTLRGVIQLTPTVVYDVSANYEQAGQILPGTDTAPAVQ